REALAERARILRLAPHLVRLEPLLFPLIGRPITTRAFYEAGMTVYDILGARRDGGWHRHLSVAETLERSPAIRTENLRGGLVFLVPWPGHWLIGTTDAPYDGPVDRPTAGAEEIDELLAAVNRVLDVDLGRDDIVGTYAGLRPLIAPSGRSTVTASREHRVVR